MQRSRRPGGRPNPSALREGQAHAVQSEYGKHVHSHKPHNFIAYDSW